MKRLGLVFLTAIGLGLWLTPIGGQQQPDPMSGAFVPGEIIVKFTRGVSEAQRRGFMPPEARPSFDVSAGSISTTCDLDPAGT